MSVPGVTVNQGCEGVPAVHVRLSPPVLVMVMVWDAGLVLAVVVNFSLVVLRCMTDGEILIVIVIGMTDGLPPVGLPVSGSTALMVTLVE